MNKLFIDFLAEELKNNKLIVFVGAGASIDSNLPSWNNLVKIFAEKLGYHNETFSNDELINIPEEYYKRFGKFPYYRILENIFSKKFFPNPIHEALEKLDFNYIITTNFDTLIEDALNKNYYYDIIKKDEDLAHTVNSKMIIKMHGDLTNKNIVLKKSDFNNYEEKFPLISTFIKGLFTTNTVLFIGYSLNDLNVKNMISWIKGILKDDFRKVYLVDFNRTSNSDDEIINKIILPDLEKEEYLGQKEKELLKNKGKLLTDFLEDLYKAKNKKIEEENYLIYSKLDYLTKFNIENLFEIYIDWGIDDEGNISYKTINEIDNEKVDLSKIKKYSEILAKSNVEVKDTKITDFIKDSDSFFKNQEKLDIVLEHIFKFNKDGFEKFLSENEELNNENLIISGYIFFGEYTKARELLNTKLNKLQISNDKERILWTYFILEKLQLIDYRSEDLKNINLKKIYAQYFKVKTLLFEEIINWKSLEENFKKINNFHERFKRNMYFSQFGEIIFLIRDIYNFLLKNGIPINFSEIKSVTKKYVEILFIAYKNDNFPSYAKLKEFNYYDYFFMILLPDDSLIDLCFNHNINKFYCKNETLTQLINTFRNLLELLDLKSINLSPFRNPLKNILFLFYKHNLKEEEFCEIVNLSHLKL